MSDIPSVDDLSLVREVVETGSIGAAARHLHLSQPSASQRLTRLERRVGLPLFERDTRGARPTSAGRELSRQADHILGHLEGAFDAVRAAAHRRTLRVATLPSLATVVLPVLDRAVAQLLGDADDTPLAQVVDHGDRLMAWVAEGTLDAAVVGVAEQLDVPAGATAYRIGQEEMCVLVPEGVESPRRGRRPLRERRVEFALYDASGDSLFASLVGAGAIARRSATVPTALATARALGVLAVVPRSGVDTRPGERVVRLPFRHTMTLSLVLPDGERSLVGLGDVLRTSLGLS